MGRSNNVSCQVFEGALRRRVPVPFGYIIGSFFIMFFFYVSSSVKRSQHAVLLCASLFSHSDLGPSSVRLGKNVSCTALMVVSDVELQ